ncbi:hypothetical protein ACGFZR_22640 [Streptomyces sp. NPDC048241]|uniref:hypothetical protein n=1 Tax=Streptomyces sp. NPDC048241 TaxID=3365521 RepID=UPI00371516F4
MFEEDVITSGAGLDIWARATDDMRDIRFARTGLVLKGRNAEAELDSLSDIVNEIDSLSGELVVGARLECPGKWLIGGVEHHMEQLFRVQAEVWQRQLLAVTLETFSDVWLTIDTRGREQLSVHAENAPRLQRVLKNASEVLGCEPTPGDENRYAVPVEGGFEDVRLHGPAYDDAWSTFEVPARSRRLRAPLPPSEDEYSEITEHPVHYLSVRDDKGQTLGYLWADGRENAAGFEPRTAVGERAFRAGRAWLLKLREAHRLGIPAADLLTWISGRSASHEAGHLVESVPQSATSLDSLEELAGLW